ncbi:MT0933-like antitoxin protein [Saccharopolyspora antimicrobica]|uniref:Antitoxin protein of toxin-antitoxin system n=1 Tax=Saccharopolyspora antimicrobica TaxID=455193 RepID=A0A1I5ISK5_9PSEU|nr:antitoxin [Saccharopolyspora antimicrobica]RKT84138.1 antitoxin protein of toxin-antitoxin system [Saccharopolyspora antimicrobica]SFO63166.1 MT0933-like antitoxin protein [Saccharopolyspora antimicrobica]
MGLGDFKDRLQDAGREHGDKIEQGLDAAADKAKEKFGHEEQIDQAVAKGKEFLGQEKPEQ